MINFAKRAELEALSNQLRKLEEQIGELHQLTGIWQGRLDELGAMVRNIVVR